MELKDISCLSISWIWCKLLKDRNYICFIALFPQSLAQSWFIANAQWVLVERMNERRKKWMRKIYKILTFQLSITMVHTYIRIQDKCMVYILWTHLGSERENIPAILFPLLLMLLLFSFSVMSDSGSSVHGIFQPKIFESVAVSFSKGCSWPSNQTHVSWVSYINRQILYHWDWWSKSLWDTFLWKMTVLIPK